MKITTATPIAAPVEREPIVPVGRSKENIPLNTKHCTSWQQDVSLPVDGSSESKFENECPPFVFKDFF